MLVVEFDGEQMDFCLRLIWVAQGLRPEWLMRPSPDIRWSVARATVWTQTLQMLCLQACQVAW